MAITEVYLSYNKINQIHPHKVEGWHKFLPWRGMCFVTANDFGIAKAAHLNTPTYTMPVQHFQEIHHVNKQLLT
jgi:hypothetical protein